MTGSIYDDKESKVLHRVRVLDRKIKFYTKVTWGLVILGVVIILPGLYELYTGTIRLNELGDYLSGSIASVWALAGVMLIFVAFLAQKQQLYYQQLELMYNRQEMNATRVEIESQKKIIEMQGEEMATHRYENTVFNMLMLLAKTEDSIVFQHDGQTYNGRDAISRAFTKI